MSVDVSPGASPSLHSDGPVAVLRLGSGENRFNEDSVAAIDACLDEVTSGGYTALVTTAEGKIWSNGMDTAWMAVHPDRAAAAIVTAERLLARLLTFPVPTVAAVQGHAFAGGLLLALAHDVRVMRADRGYLCLPEVTFGAVFTPGMTALLRARVTPQVAHRAMVLEHRFDAAEARAAQLVDETAELDALLDRAVGLAGRLAGRNRDAVAQVKRTIYADTLAVLGDPPPQGLLDALLPPAG